MRFSKEVCNGSLYFILAVLVFIGLIANNVTVSNSSDYRTLVPFAAVCFFGAICLSAWMYFRQSMIMRVILTLILISTALELVNAVSRMLAIF